MRTKKWSLLGLVALSVVTAVLVILSFLSVRPQEVNAEPAPVDQPAQTTPAVSTPTPTPTLTLTPTPTPTPTPRAPRDSTRANIRNLLTGPAPVKIVVLGDSSGRDDPAGHESWVTLWARELSTKRPVTIVDRGGASVAPTQLGTPGAEPIQIVNASDRPGQLADIVQQAPQLIPPDTDLVIVNVGHNEADTDLRANLDALWAEVPTGTMGLVMIQNPEQTSDASKQRSRIQVVQEWGVRNNVAAVDVFSAFLLVPDPLTQLLRSDLILPNQRGAEIWRDAIIAALG